MRIDEIKIDEDEIKSEQLVRLMEIEAEKENLINLLGNEMKKSNKCHMDKREIAKTCSKTESKMVRRSLQNYLRYVNIIMEMKMMNKKKLYAGNTEYDYKEIYRLCMMELDRNIIQYYTSKFPNYDHHFRVPHVFNAQNNHDYYDLKMDDRMAILKHFAERSADVVDISPVVKEFEDFFKEIKDEYFSKRKIENNRIGAAVLERELQVPRIRQFFEQSKKRRSRRRKKSKR